MRYVYIFGLSVASCFAHSAPQASYNDFGVTGLLQTPTARMQQAGEVALTLNKVLPYSRYSFSLQPFEWFEGSFRYTSIQNRPYGPEGLGGGQSYKDKGVDTKIRLLSESAWVPALSVGAIDIGGTGLFSSEYLVGSKRFADLDISLGVAWGYLGGRRNLNNPLGWLDNDFDKRPHTSSTGEFKYESFFRGPAALFGGISWQTPWDRLTLKVEYEGNNYKQEPLSNPQKQNSPINFGLTVKATDSMDFSAAFERGNTAMFGVTFHTNFSTRPAPAKHYDPPAEELINPKDYNSNREPDWAGVAQRLRQNAGYSVDYIEKRPSEIVIHGEQTRYFHPPKALGRAFRILDNSVDECFSYFTIVDNRYGMPVIETSMPRKAFRDTINHDKPISDLQRSTEHNRPSLQNTHSLYRPPQPAFDYGFGLGYKQNIGGPDGFVLYQVTADIDSEYRFAPSAWLNSSLSINLFNNFDKFKYDAPSNLPRVRTHVREYWSTSDVMMSNFQINKTKLLGDDTYALVYGGYLESMFAGVGGELLYRPFGERWAVGADLNYVRQRDFDLGFGLRDYRVLSGHVTAYFKPETESILLAISAGRYLAGDWGATVDISREFDNGVRFGAWITQTTASSQEYGEGSFDKGVYISIPFDELMNSSTLRRAKLSWAPLTRDGGARLQRTYSLYDLTEGRNLDLFEGSFRKILE